MFRSDASRRAAFARLHEAQRRNVPVRGDTWVAKRNRAALGAVGLGAAGVGLTVATGAGRRMGPVSSLTGLTGYTPGVQDEGGRLRRGTFLSSRPARRSEAVLAEFLTRAEPRTAKRVLRALEIEQLGRPKKGLPRAWEVGGRPFDMRLKKALGSVARQRLEQMSLWNLGGKGKLLDVIENTSQGAQDFARKQAEKAGRRIAERAEAPVRNALRRRGRGVRYLEAKLARKVRGLGWKLTKRAAKEAVA